MLRVELRSVGQSTSSGEPVEGEFWLGEARASRVGQVVFLLLSSTILCCISTILAHHSSLSLNSLLLTLLESFAQLVPSCFIRVMNYCHVYADWACMEVTQTYVPSPSNNSWFMLVRPEVAKKRQWPSRWCVPACVHPFGEPHLGLTLAEHMTLTHIRISFLRPSRLITSCHSSCYTFKIYSVTL